MKTAKSRTERKCQASGGRLRGAYRGMTEQLLYVTGTMLALLSLLLAGCAQESAAAQQALRSGRDAALPCQERFHDQTQTYVECIRYVAGDSKNEMKAAADWHRLGAFYTGWVSADLLAQQGDREAEGVARELLSEALRLEKKLKADEAALCALVDLPCSTLKNRQRDLLGGKA